MPGADRVVITLEVIDPDPGVGSPSGVADVWLTYNTGGSAWTSVKATSSGDDTWRATITLPAGSSASNLSFVVQAVDGAGNVAYSANKGESYSGSEGTIHLPIVLKNR